MVRRSLSILLLLVFALVDANATDPPSKKESYFATPLNRSIYLSGTFGELRPGHFHAGIDIKSINGRPGEKVLSSAQGYIARIKVSPYGYGNAIYIAHPNGYTTVYAHLDRFIPEIAEYVKQKQYELERFDVDLYPRPDQFVYKQGDHFAYLGNSGGSYGPHLHFEIRRTADQVPVNPLLHGIHIADTRPPEIAAIKVYYLGADLNQFHLAEYQVAEVSPGQYIIPDTLVEGAWRVAFGIETIDRMDGVSNRNGIYSLEMSVDDKPQFGFRMEEVSFSKSRYLNAHIDYAARQLQRKYFNLCYKQEGNALTFYEEQNDKGIINLYADKPREITFKVTDASGNSSTLALLIARDSSMLAADPQSFKYEFSPAEQLMVEETEFECVVPRNAVYSKTRLHYSVYDTVLSPTDKVYRLGLSTQPLHRYAEISMATSSIPETMLPKTAIGYFDELSEEPELVSLGGTLSRESIKTASRSFGSFILVIDTIPPEIKPVEFNTNMTGKRRMSFAITDNLPVSGKAKDLYYRATCDGNWILMEYDAKNDLLTHWFDGKISPGIHKLVIEVTDDRGNKGSFVSEFSL